MNKIELRKIVDDSYLISSSKSKLISKIFDDEITTQEELKKEILKGTKKPWAINKDGFYSGLEYRRFLEYGKIVNKEHNLDNTSRRRLVSEIEYGLIKTKYELNKEITEEKKKTELRRELKKIVNDSNLDYTSQEKLVSKIKLGKITTRKELEKEIFKEEKKNKEIKIEYEKKELLKRELLKIVYDSDLVYTSRENLLQKINNDEITSKEELKEEIEKEERKIEYRKIINEEDKLDDTSQWKLLSKINNDEITTNEELKKEISEEKKKTDLRRKLEERTGKSGKKGQRESFYPNYNTKW